MLNRWILACAVGLSLAAAPACGPYAGAPGAGPVRPIPRIARVLLVSVDGLRPDLALRADAPAIRGLMKRGSFSLWAETTDLAVTLPSHVSMLTGVPPSQHGIVWNSALPEKRGVYPAWPTLFEIARRAGYTTAMAAGKSKFSTLAKPGTLTWSFVPESSITPDAAVTDRAIAWIERSAPQVLFVHLPEVDSAGHGYGWGSPEQLAAIAGADRCIGRLLDALEKRGVMDSTLVLVTADHGGAGKNHGPDDPRSRMIPWIAAGPDVRADYDLTGEDHLTVRTEDTFATLAYVLGIASPQPIVGRPVLSIFSMTPERETRH
ncbi:MAG TPA: ectonucleotide pyrophosphatase/phosphodiesterase [Candidatus Eisenbacteria bacterium]|nr:ectonucleotide pyrophosphatase/phosphodiesterase [Candidatus Eisenbacteria bacterium]